MLSNVGLLGQPQSVLDQLATIGLGLEVPEEELQNLELGVKGTLLDGRAQIQAAIYTADWDAQSSAGLAVTLPGGGTDFIAGSVIGGKVDLWGLELEGTYAATDNLTLEATYSLNKSEIEVNNNCADCGLLIGTSDISGLGKQLSRNPETQASLSATLRRPDQRGLQLVHPRRLRHDGEPFRDGRQFDGNRRQSPHQPQRWY